MIGGSNSALGKKFSSSPNRTHRLRGLTSFLFNGYLCSFSGRLEHELDHSAPSSSEFKNECFCTSTAIICLHDMGREDQV
jgi:hypothetical protein